MSLYVLDTDIVTLLRRGHARVCQNVASHPATELAVTILTIEEQLSGWYRLLRTAKQPPQVVRAYQELADAVQFFGSWQILPYSVAAIARYDRLQALRLKVRKTDLRIAAATLEQSAILATRNRRDFQRVPNLIIEDWSI
jgi:tRNA(fMet)-specific endonuclease VapC